MRIAVDLTAVPPRLTGVGYYLAGLIAGLQAVDSTNEYYLLLGAACRDAFAVRSPRFSVVTVPDRSRPARLAWEQIALPALLTRLGIDVLHSPHYTRPLRRLRCASVVGVMDLTYVLLPEHHAWSRRMFFRRMLPAAAARADRIIAISESTKRDAAAHLGIPADRIDAIPLAISAAYRADISPSQVEATRQRLNLPPEYVLFVGTIEPRKNLVRLIRAYEEAVRADPRVPDLVLVGMRGWHTEEFDRALAESGVRRRIHTVGYVPEQDLPQVYCGAASFVYPSLYEGFGIPILEALACGVPTITSSTSSMPEVAADAALLVDPHDTGALSAAMLRLFHDRVLRDTLRQKGLTRAAAFTWERTATLTIETYRRALAAKHALNAAGGAAC
jgi:glycosyltransferase involved in cell wall biosynthesis